ncbi:MAG: PHP domain-containing protein [Firmicutes bacterium]|nr:PHP domain-containing protein [Bacillota bacterium]
MLKFSMHIHTQMRSPCGKVEPKKIVRLYKEKGYDGIIITDHYMKWIFAMNNMDSNAQKFQFFIEGYRETLKYGKEQNLMVFLGMELNLCKYNKLNSTYPVHEFLLYGLSESFIKEHPDLYELTQKELFELCNKNDILMIQAHPFRPKTAVADPEYMHGVEIVNKNKRHDSFDALAQSFCAAHNLISVASDDFHEEEDAGQIAMLFPNDTTSMKKIVQYLREKNYQILETTEKVDINNV